MAVVEQTSWGSPDRHAVVLDLVVSGMSLTLQAGTFVVDGQTYTLSEDVVWDATQRAEEAHVTGYLVLDKEDGEASLFVDEVVNDGADHYYVFDVNSPFKRLYRLFYFAVPSNASSLESVSITLHQIRDRADKPEES